MAFNEGVRSFFYEMDDGLTYTTVSRDYSNSQIIGVNADTTAVLSSGTPPAGLTQRVIGADRRFEPRYVWWQADDGSKRRKLTCFSPDADLYNGLGTAVTIEGIPGRIVGRVGERESIISPSTAP